MDMDPNFTLKNWKKQPPVEEYKQGAVVCQHLRKETEDKKGKEYPQGPVAPSVPFETPYSLPGNCAPGKGNASFSDFYFTSLLHTVFS